MFVKSPTVELKRVLALGSDGPNPAIGLATGGLSREGLFGEMGWTDRERKIYGIMPTLLGATIFHRSFSYPNGIDSIRWSEEQLLSADPDLDLNDPEGVAVLKDDINIGPGLGLPSKRKDREDDEWTEA